MRRSRALAVCLVLACISPTVAVADPVAPPPSLSSKTDALTSPELRFREAIASGRATLEEVVRLRLALLAAPPHQGGSGWRIREQAPDELDATHSYAVAAADVDGDGIDEVLVDRRPDVPCTIASCLAYLRRARPGVLSLRSADGAERWSVPTDNFISARFEDVTGDGAPEIVAFEERVLGGIVLSGAMAFRHRVKVISRTGSLMWSRDINGELLIGYGLYAYVIGLRNIVTRLVPMADVDGDAGAEMFATTIDGGGGAAYAFAVAGAFPVFATGDVWRGSDGLIAATVTARGAYTLTCVLLCVVTGGSPDVLPIGDVSGDGRADLVSVAQAGAWARIRALSAFDLAEIWTSTIPAGLYTMSSHQLDGTGPPDLLAWESNGLTRAVSGADGASLWSAFTRWLWLQPPLPLGDIDGDGGVDLGSADWAPWGDGFALTARSGATGDELWQATVHVPAVDPDESAWFDICGLCPGDHDGDGVSDILFWTRVWRSTPDPDGPSAAWHESFAWGETVAVSGASGAELWRTGRVTNEADILVAAPGDLNDNGTDDLVGATLVPQGTSTLRTFEGADATLAWSHALTVVGDPLWWEGDLVLATLDTVPGHEMLLSLGEELRTCDEFEGCSYVYDVRVHAVGAGGTLWRL